MFLELLPPKVTYDTRNHVCEGYYNGVGQAAKIGHLAKSSESIDPMPPKATTKKFPEQVNY